MRLRKMLTAMLIASLSLPKVVLAGPVLETEDIEFFVNEDEYKLSTLEERTDDSNILDVSNFNNILIQRVPSLSGKQDISIEDYKTVEVLDLSNLGLSEVPPQILLLENLKELKLDNNNISTIPEVIQEYLVGLNKFSIVDNTLVSVSTSLINKFGEDSFEFNVLPNMSNQQYKVLVYDMSKVGSDSVDANTNVLTLGLVDDVVMYDLDSISEKSETYSNRESVTKTKPVPDNWVSSVNASTPDDGSNLVVSIKGIDDFSYGTVEDLYSIDGLSLYVGDVTYGNVKVDDSMIIPRATNFSISYVEKVRDGEHKIRYSFEVPLYHGVTQIIYTAPDGKTTYQSFGSSSSGGGTATVRSSVGGTLNAKAYYQSQQGDLYTMYSSCRIPEELKPVITLTKSTDAPTKSLQLYISASVSSGSINNIRLTEPGKPPRYISNNSSITVTENGTYSVIAESDMGKLEGNSIEITNIDNVTPDLTVGLSSNSWGKSANINVSSSDKNGISKVEYKAPGSYNWATCTSNGVLNVTQNGVYTFRAIDVVGNMSTEKTVTVDKIDSTAPTLNLSLGSTAYGKTVPINIAVSDSESGINLTQYKAPNSNSWVQCTGNSTINANVNGVYTFMAVDNAGNAIEKTIEVSTVDTTVPTVSATPNNVWGRTVNIAVSSSDTGSGVARVEYQKPNEGAWNSCTSNGNLAVNKNGVYTFRSIDNAGNISSFATANVTHVDTTAPTISAVAGQSWGKTVPVTITADDTQSGLSKIEYLPPSGSWTPLGTNKTFNATVNGTYKLRALDNVGNVSTEFSLVVDKIDSTAPILNVSLGHDNFGKVIPINISSSDTQSGIKVVEYKTPTNGNWVQCTGNGTINVSANGVYTFRATDNVGNVVEKSVTVSKIDTAVPTISISKSTDSLTRELNLSIKVTDDSNTFSSVRFKKDSEQWVSIDAVTTKTITENGTYTVEATDYAGNTATSTITVSNIDRDAPVVSINQDTNWGKLVELSFTVSDVDSNIKHTFNSPNCTLVGNKIKVTENGSYVMTSTDTAGNSTQTKFTVSKVDKDAPQITYSLSDSNPTNKDVVVSYNATDVGSGVVSLVDESGKVLPNKGTLTFTKNGQKTLTATDGVGWDSSVSIDVTNIDKEPPVVKIDEDIDWCQVAELHFTATDVNDKLTYEFDSPNCRISRDGVIEVTENGSYVMTTTDSVGNVTKTPFTVSKIDKVKPVIECDPSPTTPTNKDVIISYRTSDDLSGVSRVVNSKGIEVPVNGELRFEVNGSETLTVYDNSGLSASVTVTVSNIDKSAPEVSISEMTDWGLNAVLDLTVKDDNDYTVELSSDKCTLVGNKIHVSENGTYTVRVTDKAGNVTSKEFTVNKIDTFAPEFEYELNTNDFTNKDVVIKYRSNDTGCGIKSLKVNGKPLNDFTGTITVSQNDTFIFEYMDNLGNTATTEVVVDNIDKVSPTLDCKLMNTNPTKDDVVLTFKALDDYSGVKSVTINGEQQASDIGDYIISSNGDYEVVVVDNAGNTISQTVTVSNIDKVAPVINYTEPPTDWTKEDILVDLEVTDNANPVKVTVNDKELQGNGTHYELVIKENGKYVIKATDSVGNVTQKELTVSNIERFAPTISDVNVEVYNGFVNEGILDFKVTDKESGVAEMKVNGVEVTTSSALRVDMSKDITISAKDHASNESVVVENFAHKIPNPPKFPTITLPNYRPVKDKDDNILVDQNGNLPMIDGSIIYPDGGTTGNGSLVHPDGTVDTDKDKVTSNPDGGLLLDKDGNVTDQQGNIIIDKDGNIYYPGTDNIFIDKDGNVLDKDGNIVIDSNGNVYLPDLNVDTNGDGIPDINIDIDKDGEPELNVDLDGDKSPDVDIDTDGDRVPDINVDVDKDGVPDLNIDKDQLPTWNPNTIIPGDPVYGTDSSIKPEINIDKDGDGKPDINIDIDKDGNPDINIDNNNDKIPDINIDINKDNKPDINIDIDKDGNPDINIDTNGDDIPDINIDIDKDNVPDLNIDLDGDKSPDIDIDTNLDTNPDINIDIDGDKKPDVNIDIDQLPVWKPTDISKDEPVYGTDSTIKPDINIDTDGDGKVDINIDSNGDGIPDINIDINDDGKPELNLDLDGDLSPDIDIDTNLDMKPDVNVDTDGDGVPNVNIDTNQLPTWNPTDIHKDEPLYGTDSSISPDTKLDKNNNGIPDEDEKRPVDDNANQEKPESSLPTLPELPKDEEGFKEFVDTLTESEKQQLNDMLEGVMPFTIKMDYKWEEAIGVSPKVLDIIEIKGTDFVDVSFKYIESADGVRTLVETLEPTNTLTQDTQGHWAQASIVLAGENGYMKGRTKDEFVPKGILTVAEAMITLDRVLLDGDIVYTKNERAKVEKSLVDVQDHWAYYNAGSIMTKVEYEDDKFTKDILNSNINREELARILYYVLRNITTVEDFKYPSIVYKDMLEIKDLVAVDMCTRMGIFLGDNNGMFNPKAELTRAELAEILERVAHVVKSGN